MQEDDLDALGAFTSLLRTVKEVNKLSSKPLEQWQTYYTTLKKLSDDNSYQCQELRNLSQAKSFYDVNRITTMGTIQFLMMGIELL